MREISVYIEFGLGGLLKGYISKWAYIKNSIEAFLVTFPIDFSDRQFKTILIPVRSFLT